MVIDGTGWVCWNCNKMNFLFGTFRVSFDSSGRVSIPLKMRQSFPESLRDKIWMTIGYETCIAGYNQQEYVRFLNALSGIKDSNEMEKSTIIRSFTSASTDLVFDKQGRIVLPHHLIAYAQLQECAEVLILGAINRLEIWNPDLYQKQQHENVMTVQATLRSVNLDLTTQINP
jgi:MraZ protein